MRNQARQKLARLSESDFVCLVIDALLENQRRHPPAEQPADEPLYDHVASEDECPKIPERKEGDDKNEAIRICVNLSERVINLEDQLKQLTTVNESLRRELHSLKNHLISFIEQKQANNGFMFAHVDQDELSSPTMATLRFSQTMESDYDNNTTTNNHHSTTAIMLMNHQRISFGSENARSVPTFTGGATWNIDTCVQYDTSVQGGQSNIEQATMDCIECISRFHELIKNSFGQASGVQRGKIGEQAEEVRQVLHWLANEARKSSRPPTGCMINQLKSGGDRLFCLASDHKIAVKAGNEDAARSVLDQMVDCCYEIGCCMKRLIGMTVIGRKEDPQQHLKDDRSTDQ
ncbi:hypothetical protein ACOME3_002670 [Neoechinorhynchus agilis]